MSTDTITDEDLDKDLELLQERCHARPKPKWMNHLTRKKHSKRIASLALQAGIIDRNMYDGLYMESYKEQRKPKKKFRNKGKVRWTRYYTELYYSERDYWGEIDEHNIIDYVWETLYWRYNGYDDEGQPSGPGLTIPKSTLGMIKMLTRIIKTGAPV